jgi:HSP20 family protein
MRRDDRDDPFDEFFEEIERMMNDMMSDANVHIERGPNQGGNDAGEGPGVHLDVFDEDEQLRIVADLPGVDKDDIGLKCDGETLTIDASGEVREYHERVSLPARVDEHSASASYNNGILEVSFDKAGDSADIDLE